MEFDFTIYSRQLTLLAVHNSVSFERIEGLLSYAKRLYLQSLPIIYDQRHLSLLVGLDYRYLISISNCQQAHYKQYKIPKRKSGFRTIMEPLPGLKLAQEWILYNILYKVTSKTVSKTAKAYIPGQNIRENVRYHRNKNIVLTVDLVDFFGSIKSQSVLNVFSEMGYAKSVAVLLTNLCVLNRSLPQGAPTSPMLSNMIFKNLDESIFQYCRHNGIMYSRYADDMTFSGSFEPYQVLRFLSRLLKDNGFKINGEKTKIKYRWQRQTVTNIVVNKKIQTTKSYRRAIRQEAYYILKFGLSEHVKVINTKRNTDWSEDSYLNHIRGKINYALMINPKDEEMANLRKALYALSMRRLES